MNLVLSIINMALLEKAKAGLPISDEELCIDHIWHLRDIHGETLLHWAAIHNNVELVRKLIERGVPPNTPNYRGTAPLYYAASKDAKEVCVELLKYVDPRFRSGFSGCTPDDITTNGALAQILGNAKIAIETAIKKESMLHLFRMCRWGFDTQTYRLHCDPNHNEGHILQYCINQWPDPYILRPDLENMSVLEMHTKVLHGWSQFLNVIQLKPKSASFCAGCGLMNVALKRCSKCKKVYFCSTECMKNSWLIHKSILKCKP